MSENQETAKSDNPDTTETGSDAGEVSTETQQGDPGGRETPKSDKTNKTKSTFLIIYLCTNSLGFLKQMDKYSHIYEVRQLHLRWDHTGYS